LADLLHETGEVLEVEDRGGEKKAGTDGAQGLHFLHAALGDAAAPEGVDARAEHELHRGRQVLAFHRAPLAQVFEHRGELARVHVKKHLLGQAVARDAVVLGEHEQVFHPRLLGGGQILLQLQAVLVAGGGLVDRIEAMGLEQLAGADGVAHHAFELHIGEGNPVHPAPHPPQPLHQPFGIVILQRRLDFGGDDEFSFFQSVLEFHGVPPLIAVPDTGGFRVSARAVGPPPV
jgi:hypothetical protein